MSTLAKKEQSKSRRLLSVLVVVLAVLAAKTSWGMYANYHRVKPLMDYVSQEFGFNDTTYWELQEKDCRKCHGNNTAKRHHDVVNGQGSDDCSRCHEKASKPPGVVVATDCKKSGCHGWDDVTENGWHHAVDFSEPDSCTRCHDSGVLDQISPFRSLIADPPKTLAVNLVPRPFACQNCHWHQARYVTGDPDYPGHPSTYEHFSDDNEFIGFHEYPHPIYGCNDTHHMGFKGMAANCAQCHGNNPNRRDWDPYNPELIRYCETCHSKQTLHKIHVWEDSGWAPVGFHVLDNNDPADEHPIMYKTWTTTGPYLPEQTPGISSDEKCLACHWDNMPPNPEIPPSLPFINTEVGAMHPSRVCCGAFIELTGIFFGEEYAAGFRLQMKHTDGGLWNDLPVYTWMDNYLRFKVPCWTFPPGKHAVRVITPAGNSNSRLFTLESTMRITSISPEVGSCRDWITLKGVGFGYKRAGIFPDGYYGVHHVLDFVSPNGTYTTLGIRKWSNESIEVGLRKVFEDIPDGSVYGRNFIHDDGNSDQPKEPVMMGCSDLPKDVYSAVVKAVYFADDNGDGTFSRDDTILHVAESNPVHYELTSDNAVVALSKEATLENGSSGCFLSSLGIPY